MKPRPPLGDLVLYDGSSGATITVSELNLRMDAAHRRCAGHYLALAPYMMRDGAFSRHARSAARACVHPFGHQEAVGLQNALEVVRGAVCTFVAACRPWLTPGADGLSVRFAAGVQVAGYVCVHSCATHARCANVLNMWGSTPLKKNDTVFIGIKTCLETGGAFRWRVWGVACNGSGGGSSLAAGTVQEPARAPLTVSRETVSLKALPQLFPLDHEDAASPVE